MYRNDIKNCMEELLMMRINFMNKEIKQELSYLIGKIEETMEKECGNTFPLTLDIHVKKDNFQANECFYHIVLTSLKNSLYYYDQNKMQDASMYMDKAMLHLQFID